MSLSIKGKVKLVQDLQQISDTFRKREFVLTDDSSQYTQYISFQTIQDNVSLLNDLAPGDEVEVNFNLRGREWTSPAGEVKYFNSLDAWKVTKVGAAVAPAAGMPPAPADLPPLPETEDDLPF